jgi:hypothetical protein
VGEGKAVTGDRPRAGEKTRLRLLSVSILLATLCVGVALAQPATSMPLLKPTTNETIPLTDLISVGPSSNSSIISPIAPYPYYYPSPNYSIQAILQQLLDAKDGSYTNLSLNTQNYVTTIKADEITVIDTQLSIHITGLKCVIDKYANTITVTASLIDYKQGTTTFYATNVSFTTPYQNEIMPMVGGVVPPQPSK